MNVQSRPRLPAISGLRFAAAFHLVGYHALVLGLLAGAALPALLRPVLAAGYTTTSMFLVLSGFMLYYTYVGPDGELRLPARTLWRSRFATLYPIAIVGHLLALPFSLAGQERLPLGELGLRALAAVTVTQAWIPPLTFSLDGPAWTLSCLAFFYAVFPWIAPRVSRLSPRALVLSLAGCWLVSLGIVALYFAAVPGAIAATGTDEHDLRAVLMHAFPLVRGWECLSGVILARLVLDPRLPAAARAWCERVPSAGALAALGVALVLLPERVPMVLLHNGLLLPLHWLLIGSLVAGGGLLGRLLSVRAMVKLGDSSLPLFLLHVPLLRYGRFLVGHGFLPRSAAVVVALVLAIVVASHLASVRFVQPVGAWLKRVLPGGVAAPRPTLVAVDGSAPAEARPPRPSGPFPTVGRRVA